MSLLCYPRTLCPIFEDDARRLSLLLVSLSASLVWRQFEIAFATASFYVPTTDNGGGVQNSVTDFEEGPFLCGIAYSSVRLRIHNISSGSR
jgi:hypothetical protein